MSGVRIFMWSLPLEELLLAQWYFETSTQTKTCPHLISDFEALHNFFSVLGLPLDFTGNTACLLSFHKTPNYKYCLCYHHPFRLCFNLCVSVYICTYVCVEAHTNPHSLLCMYTYKYTYLEEER